MKMILDNTALAAFNAQLTVHETAIYEEEYDDIQYSQLIPVDTSAPEWIKSVTYASVAGVGQAKWINGGAQDIPNADITTGLLTSEMELGAIGYSFTLEEIEQSKLHNFPLDSSRASAAHRAAEEFIDKVALDGDAKKNMPGLFNNAGVSATVAAQPLAGATIAQTIAVFNEGLIGNPGVKRSSYAKDTVLLPTSVLQTLGSQIVPNSSQTYLQHVMENNIYCQLLFFQNFVYMPGNGFTFAIEIGREIDRLRFPGCLDDFINVLFAALREFIVHGETVFSIHGTILGR